MHVKLNKIFLSMAFLGLAACNGGGGSDRPAAVPTNSGRVYAQGNQNSYCETTTVSGSNQNFICYSVLGPGAQPQASQVIPFTDLAVLCQQLRNTYLQVGDAAKIAFVNQRCSAVGGPQPLPIPHHQFPTPNLPLPTDEHSKLFQCEVEALRNHRNGGMSGIPKAYGEFIIDTRLSNKVDLVQKIPSLLKFLDGGRFGSTSMIYTPAGYSRNKSDTITLRNQGLNRDMEITQSGFAGEIVQLIVENQEKTLLFKVACLGRNQHKKALPRHKYTKFVCRGISNLTSRRENIDETFRYDRSLLNKEIELATGLTMNVSGDTGNGDGARIILQTSSTISDNTVMSSAYLKTPSQLKMRDSYSDVDVTCYPTY